MRLTKNVKNVLTLTVLAAALYAASYFLVGATFVPQNFTDARINNAKATGELVEMINPSLVNLDKILQYNQNNAPKEALDLVQQELVSGKQRYDKANTLLSELNNMSNASNGITPIKARNLAVDAINQEIALIGKLFEYNDSFNSLLENLQLKFSVPGINNSAEIQTQIETMNSTGKEVNDLNELFNQKMAEFDKLTNQ